MRTAKEIRERLTGLLVQELERRVSEAKKRLPALCMYHLRHTLDTRKMVNGEPNPNYNTICHPNLAEVTIGLCMSGSEDCSLWTGNICEDPIDAQRCPVFKAKKQPKAILKALATDLATPGWVAQCLPEAAALLWVLDEVRVCKLPWWKRLWFRILRVRVEPVIYVEDPVLLLEEAQSPD